MVTIRCGTQQFSQIEAIVFDKDGTLANCEAFLRNLAQCRSRLIDAQVPGVEAPLRLAFGVDGDQIDPAGLMAVGTRLENEIAAAAYIAETGKSWAESLKIARSGFVEADQYLAQKAPYAGLVAGANEFIQGLATTGIKLAIFSADRMANVEAFVAAWPQNYFQAVWGVDDSYPAKSDQSLQQLLAQLGVQPQQTILIGDSSLDAQIAQAANLAGFIGFLGGWSVQPAIVGADVIVERFEQIEIESLA